MDTITLLERTYSMLSEPVQLTTFSSSVVTPVLKRLDQYDWNFNRVPSNNIMLATKSIGESIRYVSQEHGLPSLSQPKEAPLSESFIMRALVMMRCIYQYELMHPDESTAIKSGMFKDLRVTAPSQADLCADKDGYKGMIQDTYELLDLGQIGYPADKACSGSPHIQASAHLLAEAGCILPRGVGKDFDAEKSKRSVRTPYALTPQGRLFSFWIFGDKQHVVGNYLYGYTGVRAVVRLNDDVPYSGWLRFIGL